MNHISHSKPSLNVKMTKEKVALCHLRHAVVGANKNKMWTGDVERVASFQIDVNSSTSHLKMRDEERWGKQSNKIIANTVILETATNERNDSGNSSRGNRNSLQQ